MLEHWALLEADFQQVYHLDISTDLLDHRSKRWLEVRTAGLLSTDSRLRRALFAPNEPEGGSS